MHCHDAGKPKGVLHTTSGYMVMAWATTRYVFDLQAGDTWWCTADPGLSSFHFLDYKINATLKHMSPEMVCKSQKLPSA